MIGIDGKPFICHADKVDTEYLKKNEWNIHKAIANANPKGWSATTNKNRPNHHKEKNINIYPMDDKHLSLINHRGIEYNLDDIKDKQLFEQLQFKIYNVGYYLPLKNEYLYNDSFEHFKFMEDFFNSLPFKRVKKILLMVLPAGCETVIHRDPLRDRFIYLRPDFSKDFFVFDEDTKTKHYVDTLAAEWAFEEWHGADAKPYANYAIKVAGDLYD